MVEIPGDKSISHRALIIGSLAKGKTRIKNFLHSKDCLATLNIMRRLGVKIEKNNESIIVHGVGLQGLKGPKEKLHCHNSGTTMRLLAGVLSAFYNCFPFCPSCSNKNYGKFINGTHNILLGYFNAM